MIDVAPAFTAEDAAAMEARFAGVSTQDMLRDLLGGELKGRIAAVSSFGTESAVLLHMVAQVDQFFRALLSDASVQRYGEYRAHIEYMDLIAQSYDFNNGALWRLNDRLKTALDPNGIVAPGKSGIWGSTPRRGGAV
jgi:3'-phosphoadenosine 5'-phosphosulfate sulfotransferase (PAPS reductase)/FAD synthetase